ncbi:uncharacterized protein LOC129952259 isoform X2 [Eupeodes corollae]|uniref:uncharacterized protein LOC129952259 isoform X2 n=1 Tax=Eupeodes corollae TaxID=290404 RepID=UPI002493521B|nr:uncharacterized protein LOC129952259 isoform X2 [Eupeodes corollae]
MYMLDTKIAIMDNKESSNLLQHSENLSLSDLELPEIEHQRKRKVRRKTRPKLPTGRQRIESTTYGHRNIILLGTVFFITSCWLLILSYTMSVIHIENQRLQSEIKKVSVISQNLPEEMQKWHEKSSFLEKNQSIIYEKLNEIQIAIESLKTNFTKYAARADSRNEYSKDDKFVADLGAKLEAVASDMEIIKDHFTTVQKNQSILQEDIDKLGVRFNDISNHIPEKSKDEDVCLQKVQSLQTRYENEIKSVTANISIVNDTLTQKSGIISDELLVHKTKIDDLMDKTANITSHVSSIKNDWTKYKQQIVDCDAKVENFENSMSQIVNKTNILEKSIQEVRLNCSLSDGLGRNCINLTDTTPQINKTNGLNVK